MSLPIVDSIDDLEIRLGMVRERLRSASAARQRTEQEQRDAARRLFETEVAAAAAHSTYLSLVEAEGELNRALLSAHRLRALGPVRGDA